MIEFDAKNFDGFIQLLYTKQDINYKSFNDKVVNGVGESIGIRTPELRSIAKEISKSPKNREMISLLHKNHLFEARIIEGMLIGIIKIPEDCIIKQVENFVEDRINNWAVCDSFVMGLKNKVKQNKALFYETSNYYLTSEKQWEIRFGLVMLLRYFKEKTYFVEINNMIFTLKSQEYYVKMAAAWLICELYINLKDETMEILKNPSLDIWTRNKAIQKIKESYRVSELDKMEADSVKLLFNAGLK